MTSFIKCAYYSFSIKLCLIFEVVNHVVAEEEAI